MDEREFYQLCYDQYKAEMAESQSHYQRAGVLLAVLPGLAAVSYALGRTDLLARFFERVDIFLYHVSMVGAAGALGISAWHLVKYVYPRSEYQSLASMKKWQAWREDYRKVLTPDNQSPNAPERATAVPMLSSIIPLLADAQQKNAELNEGRRKQFQKSICAAAVAMVAVAGQSFFRLTLHLQGM